MTDAEVAVQIREAGHDEAVELTNLGTCRQFRALVVDPAADDPGLGEFLLGAEVERFQSQAAEASST